MIKRYSSVSILLPPGDGGLSTVDLAVVVVLLNGIITYDDDVAVYKLNEINVAGMSRYILQVFRAIWTHAFRSS